MLNVKPRWVQFVLGWVASVGLLTVGHSMLDCTDMQISESGLLTWAVWGTEWNLTNPPGLTLHSHCTQVWMVQKYPNWMKPYRICSSALCGQCAYDYSERNIKNHSVVVIVWLLLSGERTRYANDKARWARYRWRRFHIWWTKTISHSCSIWWQYVLHDRSVHYLISLVCACVRNMDFQSLAMVEY